MWSFLQLWVVFLLYHYSLFLTFQIRIFVFTKKSTIESRGFANVCDLFSNFSQDVLQINRFFCHLIRLALFCHFGLAKGGRNNLSRKRNCIYTLGPFVWSTIIRKAASVQKDFSMHLSYPKVLVRFAIGVKVLIFGSPRICDVMWVGKSWIFQWNYLKLPAHLALRYLSKSESCLVLKRAHFSRLYAFVNNCVHALHRRIRLLCNFMPGFAFVWRSMRWVAVRPVGWKFSCSSLLTNASWGVLA